MAPLKLIIRLPADSSQAPAGLFVKVFHRWIQEQSVADHLPIDVADYGHVAGGPGTILVCSEANIHVDSDGLAYVRKRPWPGIDDAVSAIAAAVRTAVGFASLLECDPAVAGAFRADPRSLNVRFNDRLTTPNSVEAGERLVPVVRIAVRAVFPDRTATTIRAVNSADELLDVRVDFPT